MIPWSYIKWWFPWWNKKKLPNADSLRHVAFVVFYPMFQKYSVSAPCLKGHRLIIMMIMSWISKTQIVALKPTNLICPWTCDISYLLKKRWIRHWQNIVVLSLMYLCNIYIYIYTIYRSGWIIVLHKVALIALMPFGDDFSESNSNDPTIPLPLFLWLLVPEINGSNSRRESTQH